MAEQVVSTEQPQQQYKRFSSAQRLEHMILLLSFSGLALTGLPQMFASQGWAQTTINLLGGIESVRILHRFLAILLMLEAIYHGGIISYKFFVLGARPTMLPGLRDLRDVRDWILYNLGFRDEHPQLPHFNFGEKAEYLAVVWGTLLMIATGFLMWNPIAAADMLPGEVIPAARAAHGGEAVLAVLSILTWHMYNVHIKRFNRSMFTGSLSREEMEEEHAEELAARERGEVEPVPPPAVISSRQRRFFPFALGMTAILVSALFWFVNLETTAISTVPRQRIVVYAPQVTVEEGDAALGESLWPTLRCARCHGDNAQGSPDVPMLLGTSGTFEEFHQQVRTGKGDMPAFSTGTVPDNYLFHLWTWLSTETSAG